MSSSVEESRKKKRGEAGQLRACLDSLANKMLGPSTLPQDLFSLTAALLPPSP